MQEEKAWHLDKLVPIALIITIVVQTIGIGWWAATITARLDTLEKRVDSAAPQADRLTRVEVKLETAVEGIADIKMLLRDRYGPAGLTGPR